MEVIKINTREADTYQGAIKRAIEVLNSDGVIAFPTDTVYGFGANALEPFCIHKLFRLKKRPEKKALPVIVRDIEMAKELAFIDAKKEKFLRSVWPGPVTVILEKRNTISGALGAGSNTVGLRIPNCLFVQKLMQDFQKPLAATSANLSGEPVLPSAQKIIEAFGEARYKPDLIIDAGELSEALPSTVIDLTKSKPLILRQGPIKAKDLMEILEQSK